MLAVTGLYGHMRRNAQKSILLLLGFFVLVALFWLAWCIIFAALFDGGLAGKTKSPTLIAILQSGLSRAAAGWWIAPLFTGAWFAIAWRFHDNIVSAATGAKPATRIDEPRLYNLVENLAISIGMPTPRIEIMPADGLNAYAAGLGPQSAVIGVTRGLLDKLNDSELEAVLAHEMTHIRNSDVRLMAVATIFAGGLTILGRTFLRLRAVSPDATGYGLGQFGSRSSKSRESGPKGAAIIAIVIAIALLALTHVLSLLIKFAISRSREFMADAGAVELTHNPDAMISALLTISQNDSLPNVDKGVMAMMISAEAAGAFATHPPITERIRALQTYADGRLPPEAQPALARTDDVADGTGTEELSGVAAPQTAFGVRSVGSSHS